MFLQAVTQPTAVEIGPPQSDWATPDCIDTTPAHTLEPCSAKQQHHIVEMMATIAAENQEALINITKLCKQAMNLRAVIKAERARQERLDAYIRYWRDIEPHWLHHEVWGESWRASPHRPNTIWEEVAWDEMDYEEEPLYVACLISLLHGADAVHVYTDQKVALPLSDPTHHLI